jgi:predicted DNA-binding protein YlxM (UPF0122 family)
MMGRRTPVIAIADGDEKHYRSLSEAAEDNSVNKVDIWRAIRRGKRINGYFFDYEMEVLDGNRERD